MGTLKGRNAHKGRTFGGVAACPHCSAPIRVFVTVARTQCVLDVVDYSYLVPPYPADPGVAVAHALRVGSLVAASASEVSTTATAGVSDRTEPPAVAGAERSVAYSDERGFDDDEDPVPPTQGRSQVDLFR